ncbi:MAG: hypothetical protein NT072_08350 [Deltaproteobacteria bacterium]|nr:hypothetical protein [Deltaproteobacteria bacterium]
MATSEKRQVTQLISALIILKRNAEVYLSGHMIITQSLNNAFEILQEILSVKPLLTIGVAHHLLFIKDDTLDGRSPYVQEFAVLLNNLGVISITFRRGITKDELLRLQNIFRTNPNDLWKRGSLQSNLSAHRITHVDLKSLDLRQFNITVEKEIVYEKVKDKGKSDKDWRKLIDAILTYDADMKGPMTAVEHSSSIESARLPIKKNEGGRHYSKLRDGDRTLSAHP